MMTPLQCSFWIFLIFPLIGNDRIVISIPPPSSTTPKPQPDWSSIDSRPTPAWFDKAKIGIFIHWGVYSVPSYLSEWYWIDWKGDPSPNKNAQIKIKKFMADNYKPGFTYQDFARDFTAEFFNATEWANLIEKSGARYVILTSKHHDGYALWPSNYSYSWNSMDVGPHRDIIGELAKAVREKKGIHFGLYHSLYEWFHPLWISDKASNFKSNEFVNNKILPEMKELVNKYKPEIFWSDGEWEAESEYWKSVDFLNWLFNESPVKDIVAVNDRWGHETQCKHGGYYTCSDRYNPGVLQFHKWENAMTLDRNSWGYNRKSNIEDYLSAQDLIDTVVETISCRGNIAINIGPSKDGTINPIFQERLHQLGDWLKVNGEAIYDSQPYDRCQNDTVAIKVWYTTQQNSSVVYAIVLRWPSPSTLYLACVSVTSQSKITMLGVEGNLQYSTISPNLLKIGLPDKALVKNDWAWVIKISGVNEP